MRWSWTIFTAVRVIMSEDCSFYCMVTVMVVLRVNEDGDMVIAYPRCRPEEDNNILLQGLTAGDVTNIRPEDLSNFFRVNHNDIYIICHLYYTPSAALTLYYYIDTILWVYNTYAISFLAQ